MPLIISELASAGASGSWGVADGAPLSDPRRWEVGASMALLFPIPGALGRIFATSQASAWDEEVLRALQPSLIINLTRKSCPRCALSFSFFFKCRHHSLGRYYAEVCCLDIVIGDA